MLTRLLLPALVLASLCQASTQQTYTNKWDKIDIDQILKNDRILKKYVDCLMDRGKCSPDAQELRKVLPEAMKTECAKCTDAQKRMAGKAMSYILQYKRNYWNELLEKYDPKGEFRKKYEYEEKYLATGKTFASLAYSFRISRSYISRIVKDTLKALSKKLKPIFLPPPSKKLLEESAANFYRLWNFPNCVAAIDGKHIRIFCPKKSGSLFFNYKDYFSIVLLALVDANYRFIAVDVGSYGKEGDSSIFNKSEFGRQLNDSNFYPPDAKLPESSTTLPHVTVGDEAFRLHKHIMKPYDKKSARLDSTKAIFNYRLSRARQVSENSFALLSQVWRVFYTHISVRPETAEELIVVACCLHNMLWGAYLENNGQSYHNLEPSVQTENFQNLTRPGGFHNTDGFDVRNEYSKYFVNEGAVPWQQNRI